MWYINILSILFLYIVSASSSMSTLAISVIISSAQQSCWGGGYIGFTASVCLSIRPSHMRCLLRRLLPISWIIFICGTNTTHGGTMCCAPFPGQLVTSQGHMGHSNSCGQGRRYLHRSLIYNFSFPFVLVSVCTHQCSLICVATFYHQSFWYCWLILFELYDSPRASEIILKDMGMFNG